MTDLSRAKVFGRAETRLLNERYNTTLLLDLVKIDGEEQRRRRPEVVLVQSALYDGMDRVKIASDRTVFD